jgi:hypothetical protein
MSTLKQVLVCLIVMAVSAMPLMAGGNEAKPANGNAANAEPAAAANPNPSPNLTATPGNANVTALLGVLVKKGVLGSAEADAIRNAAPEAEFQLLVEALSRKGVLSAADLSVAASPAAQPAAPVALGNLLLRRRGRLRMPHRNLNHKPSRRRLIRRG